MPKVSVIIPNYNHAQFLEQRLNSVLNQTYQDFEVIFLDDASTDNSREVFAKYENHPKFSHIVFNKVNSGSPFRQWNRGIDLASGEYVWIAESDDYAELNFLELLVPCLDNNLKIGIAYCESIRVDQNEKQQQKFSSSFFAPERWKDNFINSGLTECSHHLCAENTIPNASAVLFRRSLYDTKIRVANENFRSAGDWFTWASILLHPSDICFLAQGVNYFRCHGSNTSINASKVGLVVKESLTTFNLISSHILIPREAKYNAFKKIVLSWWLGYLWSQKFSVKDEFSVYLNILDSFFEYYFKYILHIKLLKLSISKLRYNLAIGTKFKLLKNNFHKIL